MYERKHVGGRAIISLMYCRERKKQFANENKWFQRTFWKHSFSTNNGFSLVFLKYANLTESLLYKLF